MGLFSRSKEPFVKVVFATDLHGSTSVLRKLITATKNYEADHVVIGGDITGKAIVPIYREGTSWKADLFGSTHTAETQEEMLTLSEHVEAVGMYPYEMDAADARQYEDDESKLDDLFLRLMRQRLERWGELLEEHFAGTDIRCYWVPGNDDRHELDDVFESFQRVVNVDNRVVRMDEKHEIAGLAEAKMTPWRCERDEEEDQIEARLGKVMAALEDPEAAVLNFHCPPKNTKIDQCPEIDENFEIKRIGGQVLMTSAGSAAIREAIERYQPLLGLHGHVHEARGSDKIGRTTVINPGSEYGEGLLRAVVVNLQPDNVKGILQFSG